ncbi:MAG: SCO family protein [Cocleimonas sp.]|nr:SCO family protein [Cocleimonas sp.]
MLKITIILKMLIILVIVNSVSYVLADNNKLPIYSGVGGEFTAVDSNGKDIKLSDYKGKTVVLAFGYTNCADICPFTLGYLKQLYKTLSVEEQKQTRFIFVTIDPEYDTPEHLKAFVEFFNKDFIGLSGTKEQIEFITSLYKAEYSDLSEGKVPTKDIRRVTPQKTGDKNEKASLFSHTVVLYLLDKKGYTRSLEYTGTPKDEFARKIRELIHE